MKANIVFEMDMEDVPKELGNKLEKDLSNFKFPYQLKEVVDNLKTSSDLYSCLKNIDETKNELIMIHKILSEYNDILSQYCSSIANQFGSTLVTKEKEIKDDQSKTSG